MTPIIPFFAQQCSPLAIEPAGLPAYTPLFVHAGVMSNTNHHGYCEEFDTLTIQKCDYLVNIAHWIVQEKMPDEHPRIYENPVGYLEKGTEIYISGEPTVHYWSNPQKEENFKKAVFFINENMLIPGYFDCNPEKIVSDIKTIHKILNENIIHPHHDRNLGGEFRDTQSGILVDQGSKLKNVGFVKPEMIESEMHKYAEQLKEYASHVGKQDSEYPFDAASYAHTEFIRIHPFHDFNGKPARLLSYIMGSHLGLDHPTLFFDEKEYDEIAADLEAFTSLYKKSYEKTGHFVREKLKDLDYVESESFFEKIFRWITY